MFFTPCQAETVKLGTFFIICHIVRDHGWIGAEFVSITRKDQTSLFLKLLVTNTFHGLMTSSSLPSNLLTCIKSFTRLITFKTSHPWCCFVQFTNPPTPLRKTVQMNDDLYKIMMRKRMHQLYRPIYLLKLLLFEHQSFEIQ